MARLDPGAVEAFERDARRMYFSKDTVGRFLEGATPTQLAAVRGLLRSELAARESRSGAGCCARRGSPS